MGHNLNFYDSERLGTLSTTNNKLRDNVGSVRVLISNTKTPTGQANNLPITIITLTAA